MIKHFISLCLLGLLLVLAQGTATAAGKWRIHPSYVGTGIQNIVDAGDKVYYLVSNNLYCLDKSTGENQSLNKVNSLNDASITGIYYNDYKHYLMIAYADANIDVITSNGRVVNLPDIMAASLTSTKAINDITFTAGGEALVATTFGYVVYNDTKWEVKESHIYNTSISSAAVVGDYVLLSAGSNIYYGKAGTHYETLGSMMSTGDNDNGRIYPIADNKFMLLTGWTFEYTVTPNPDGTLAFASATIVENMTDNLHRTPQGYLGNCMGSQFYYTLDDSGTLQSKVDGGTAMYSAYSDGDGTLWSVTPRGLHSAADTAAYYMPDAITTATPYWLRYDTRNNLLYVTSTGTNSLITEQRLPTAGQHLRRQLMDQCHPLASHRRRRHLLSRVSARRQDFLPDGQLVERHLQDYRPHRGLRLQLEQLAPGAHHQLLLPRHHRHRPPRQPVGRPDGTRPGQQRLCTAQQQAEPGHHHPQRLAQGRHPQPAGQQARPLAHAQVERHHALCRRRVWRQPHFYQQRRHPLVDRGPRAPTATSSTRTAPPIAGTTYARWPRTTTAPCGWAPPTAWSRSTPRQPSPQALPSTTSRCRATTAPRWPTTCSTACK
jgi:hypothetical protein